MKFQIQKNQNRFISPPDTSSQSFDFRYLSLQNFKFDNDTFFFNLVYRDPNWESKKIAQSNWFPLCFYQVPQIDDDPATGKWIAFNYLILLQNRNQFWDTIGFNNIVRIAFNGTSSTSFPPILKIDKELNDKLNEIQNILKGFPVSFSDNFWRMFYFSAITVTTLGYGDIVPLTNTARMLVSAEAVLGVILIGLFLNSLSKKFVK